jgi:zinc D-Ala-D-Ala carboxypeptidase
MTQLSRHFTLKELCASEIADRNNIDNAPKSKEILDNLKHLADNLEHVRSVLNNNPIHINSAYRSNAVNSILGSKSTSAHTKGLAADFICPSFGSPRDIVSKVIASNIQYDQIILEFDRWCHIGFAPKGQKPRLQKLIIDRNGTRPFNS